MLWSPAVRRRRHRRSRRLRRRLRCVWVSREEKGGGGLRRVSASVGLFLSFPFPSATPVASSLLAHLVPRSLSGHYVRYLQIQIPDPLGAITQPLEPGPLLSVDPLPLARRSSLTSFSVKALRCSSRMQRAAHSWCTPLGVQHLPTWPRHNCIPVRLTRSTHYDRQHLRSPPTPPSPLPLRVTWASH